MNTLYHLFKVMSVLSLLVSMALALLSFFMMRGADEEIKVIKWGFTMIFFLIVHCILLYNLNEDAKR